MQRIGFIMHVRPGSEQEYKRRHDEIWPEMLEAMTRAGIRNYTIFMHGTALFNYFECEDWQAAVQKMGETDVSARWGAYMSDIMEPVEGGGQDRFPPLWSSVFHFNGT